MSKGSGDIYHFSILLDYSCIGACYVVHDGPQGKEAPPNVLFNFLLRVGSGTETRP